MEGLGKKVDFFMNKPIPNAINSMSIFLMILGAFLLIGLILGHGQPNTTVRYVHICEGENQNYTSEDLTIGQYLDFLTKVTNPFWVWTFIIVVVLFILRG